MGMFKKNCSSGAVSGAPAPDPFRWELLSATQFEHAYVLKVRYPDATNFEGVKVMVYLGRFPGIDHLRGKLDPHFDHCGFSPIARFRPDEQGFALACTFAGLLFDDSKGG